MSYLKHFCMFCQGGFFPFLQLLPLEMADSNLSCYFNLLKQAAGLLLQVMLSKELFLPLHLKLLDFQVHLVDPGDPRKTRKVSHTPLSLE